MIKPYNITGNSILDIFQTYLRIINWTLKEQLTEAEMEILSYLLYYNNHYYTQIKDDQIRFDLLFSSVVKRKLKEEFNVSSAKVETYLNKLRKKGIIEKNQLSPRVIIYLQEKLEVRFSINLKGQVELPSPTQEPIKQEITPTPVAVIPTPSPVVGKDGLEPDKVTLPNGSTIDKLDVEYEENPWE